MTDFDTLTHLSANASNGFYLFHRGRFIDNLNKFGAMFQRCYGSNVTLAYSLKTNNLPFLCKLVCEANCSVETVSEFEYNLACALKFPRQRIILNGPVKSESLLERALNSGSLVFLDSDYELGLLNRIKNTTHRSAWRIGLRCAYTHAADEVSRFGFSGQDGALSRAAHTIENEMGIKLLGLQFHYAKQPKSVNAFVDRARYAIDSCQKVFPNAIPQFIDLGGGFPSLSESPDDLNLIASATSQVIHDAYGENSPHLILEPGFSVVNDTFSYVCSILDMKQRGGQWIASSTGSFHLIRPTSYERNINASVISPACKGEKKKSVLITGYTCMEHDQLITLYDKKIERGDFVLFSNVGAYTSVLKPPFTMLSPAVFAEIEGQWALVRRADSVCDFLRTSNELDAASEKGAVCVNGSGDYYV